MLVNTNLGGTELLKNGILNKSYLCTLKVILIYFNFGSTLRKLKLIGNLKT
jgi:hypothetical protein